MPVDTRLSQARETESHLVRRTVFAYRYAYARSAESRLAGDNGQDYLSLREDEKCLVFALCDGVGQSFFGDLAARRVGETLVDWLWQRALVADDEDSLRLALTQRLNTLAPEVAAQVQAIPLPDDLSPLVQEVLEQKRQFGSHSTFAAGRLDLTLDRLALVWLGDSPIRFWGTSASERTFELGDTFRTESRWSSQSGVLGVVNVFLTPLHGVTRVLAYSDGLAAAADFLLVSPSDRQLDEVMNDLAVSPTSDDISMLEIWLGKAPVKDRIPLPAPRKVELAYRDGQLALNWSPVPGARHHQVEVSNGGARRWQVDYPPQTLEVEASSAWGAMVRIRGWDDNGPGEWSAPVPLLVELPLTAAAVVDAGATLPPPLTTAAGGRSRWAWVLLSLAALVVLVCLAGALLTLRGGALRQRLLPTATLPVKVFDGPAQPIDTPTPVRVTDTPTALPSPTLAPTTTPWQTWTPVPVLVPSPTATMTIPLPSATTAALPAVTVTPTPIPSPTLQETPAPEISPPAPSPTLSPTLETEIPPPVITLSPEPGDLSPRPEGDTLGSRIDRPGSGRFTFAGEERLDLEVSTGGLQRMISGHRTPFIGRRWVELWPSDVSASVQEWSLLLCLKEVNIEWRV